MVAIITVLFISIWISRVRKRIREQVEAGQTDFGIRPDGGGREDYYRGYYGGSERIYDGNRQNTNGGGIGPTPWE